METMVFGILAVAVLTVSVFCICGRKPVLALVSGTLSAVLTVWTGVCWRAMLTASGKDAAWLGFQRYPAAVILLALLLVASVTVMTVSVIRITRGSKS